MIAYSGEKDNSYASDNNYFVEIRDIDDNGMMGEGRPVTVDFMNELVRGYSESHSTTPYGRIPPICCGAIHARDTRVHLVQSSGKTADVLCRKPEYS